ncbi:hypothetical protein Godav_022362 [Gossypium davidsonii]|uniref:PHD finger protein ALFIN-LIKE n=1 Tax=Gossypium davidsonii TaxID=34287 RepID=A0A7J8TCI2_GOSDV|nr:hypothetical protein [Gossypium davidsonii]
MASSSPRTVEEIFKDYNARHSALVRALTYDVDDFYSQCDPGQFGYFNFFFSSFSIYAWLPRKLTRKLRWKFFFACGAFNFGVN